MAKNKNARRYSIQKSARKSRTLYLIVAILVTASAIALSILSLTTKQNAFMIIVASLFLGFFIFTLIFGYILFSQSYTSLLSNLIENTKENYQKDYAVTKKHNVSSDLKSY